jgi:hypothetical protein
LAFYDLQVDNRTVADVSPATWQPILIVAIPLKIGAPGLAPEGKCCNFEDSDGGGPEKNWAERFRPPDRTAYR